MKKTSILALIGTGLFAFILFSCSIDNSNLKPNKDVEDVKMWFKINKPSLEVLNYTNTIDWNNAIVTNGFIGKVVEVPLVLKKNTTTNIGDDEPYKTDIRLLFIEDEKETYRLYDVIFSSKDPLFDNKNKKNNFYSIDPNYSGFITLHNATNQIIDSKKYNNGVIMVSTKKNSTTAKWVCRYIITVGNYETCKYVWVPDIGNCVACQDPLFAARFEGGNANGYGTGNGTYISQQIEDQITPVNLTPCVSNVLESIKTLKQMDISKIFLKLGATNRYKTTILSENPSTGAPAAASYSSGLPFNYKIQISTDYEGKTKLFIASILIHEMIHAYFFSIVDEYNSNPNNINKYNLNSFPSLFQAFCDKRYPPSDSQDVHHLAMASEYVNAISRSLQEYQTGIPVPENQIPDQIYTDLAWGGLSKAPVFDEKFPLGNPNRQRILNRLAAEQTGYSIGAGTKDEQKTIGKPCN